MADPLNLAAAPAHTFDVIDQAVLRSPPTPPGDDPGERVAVAVYLIRQRPAAGEPVDAVLVLTGTPDRPDRAFILDADPADPPAA